jgi:hypothetical protein
MKLSYIVFDPITGIENTNNNNIKINYFYNKFLMIYLKFDFLFLK